MKPYNRMGHPDHSPEAASMYRDFDATELYCPRCRQAVPVRRHLLLVLPDGDKYEYRCAYCGETVGTKMDHHRDRTSIIV